MEPSKQFSDAALNLIYSNNGWNSAANTQPSSAAPASSVTSESDPKTSAASTDAAIKVKALAKLQQKAINEAILKNYSGGVNQLIADHGCVLTDITNKESAIAICFQSKQYFAFVIWQDPQTKEYFVQLRQGMPNNRDAHLLTLSSHLWQRIIMTLDPNRDFRAQIEEIRFNQHRNNLRDWNEFPNSNPHRTSRANKLFNPNDAMATVNAIYKEFGSRSALLALGGDVVKDQADAKNKLAGNDAIYNKTNSNLKFAIWVNHKEADVTKKFKVVFKTASGCHFAFTQNLLDPAKSFESQIEGFRKFDNRIYADNYAALVHALEVNSTFKDEVMKSGCVAINQEQAKLEADFVVWPSETKANTLMIKFDRGAASYPYELDTTQDLATQIANIRLKANRDYMSSSPNAEPPIWYKSYVPNQPQVPDTAHSVSTSQYAAVNAATTVFNTTLANGKELSAKEAIEKNYEGGEKQLLADKGRLVTEEELKSLQELALIRLADAFVIYQDPKTKQFFVLLDSLSQDGIGFPLESSQDFREQIKNFRLLNFADKLDPKYQTKAPHMVAKRVKAAQRILQKQPHDRLDPFMHGASESFRKSVKAAVVDGGGEAMAELGKGKSVAFWTSGSENDPAKKFRVMFPSQKDKPNKNDQYYTLDPNKEFSAQIEDFSRFESEIYKMNHTALLQALKNPAFQKLMLADGTVGLSDRISFADNVADFVIWPSETKPNTLMLRFDRGVATEDYELDTTKDLATQIADKREVAKQKYLETYNCPEAAYYSLPLRYKAGVNHL